MSAAARPAAMTEKMARKVAAKRGSTLAAKRERPDEAAACVDGMAGRFPCSRAASSDASCGSTPVMW